MSQRSTGKRYSESENEYESLKKPMIQIIGVKGLPIVKEGDNLAKLICNAAEQQRTPIQEEDILVVTHVVVSRAEGNVVNLDSVVPSDFAKTFAQRFDKDPALIETVLQESRSVVRMGDGKLITETKHGFICANAGVDQSNVPGERNVAPLPKNPDRSAQKIRREIRRLTKKEVAVIISDTHGRPLREGEINVAIGVAGIRPIRDRMVIGQASEGIPVAIIRGYPYPESEEAKATQLTRPREKDLFA